MQPAAAAAAATAAALERLRLALCWRARDKAHLGLGSMLYLNALRWMALTFFALGLLAAPNALANDSGRITLAAVGGDVLEFAAARYSVANLAPEGWTPGGVGFCHGHGFAASVCLQWSSGVTDAFDYPCNGVPAGVSAPSFEGLPRSLISGEVRVTCASPATACSCFPGWTGATCGEPANSSATSSAASAASAAVSASAATSVPGFCTPPGSPPWWTLSPGAGGSGYAAREAARIAAEAARDPDVCSGRGACALRTTAADTTVPAYAFCQCDEGFFGPTCAQRAAVEGAGVTFGAFDNVPHVAATSAQCSAGATPFLVRNYFILSFPSARCSEHGFGVVQPLAADGRLNVSSRFRVQTRGVCFCEPGFDGEECLGGAPVPASEGFWLLASLVVLVLSLSGIYRVRRHMEQALDDATVTPHDFSLFVNGLPELSAAAAGDLARVREHFEQFGPVHAVSPAPDDEDVFYCQAEKNLAMLALQINLETNVYAAAKKAAKASGRDLSTVVAAAVAAAAAEAAAPPVAVSTSGWVERPAWSPVVSPLLEARAPATAASLPFVQAASVYGADPPKVERSWDALAPFLRVCAWLGLRGLLPAPALRALVRHLDDLLKLARVIPATWRFRRAFVTMAYSLDAKDVIEAYEERSMPLISRGGEGQPPKGTLEVELTRTGEKRVVNVLFGASRTSAGAGASRPSSVVENPFHAPSNRAASSAAPAASAPAVPSAPVAIGVHQAMEPDEVLWDALDTGLAQHVVRAAFMAAYLVGFVVFLFWVITSINSKTASKGIAGLGIALGVVLLNMAAARSWVAIADIFQSWSIGGRQRLVYYNVLATQLCITIMASTLGVYGYPLDGKNGTVQDFCASAGAFLFKTVVIEAVLPVVVALVPREVAFNALKEALLGTPSKTRWLESRYPPQFRLEVRCASLMRTVILSCAFAAGLPVLNFLVSACLALRYIADTFVFDNRMRLMRAGAELPRALELTLLFAVVVQACMSWVLLSIDEAPSSPAFENATLVVLPTIGLVVAGYFSYKCRRARDCFCGLGERAAGSISPHARTALRTAHSFFMRAALGSMLFDEVDDTYDETKGVAYADLVRRAHDELERGTAEGKPLSGKRVLNNFLLRAKPYVMLERLQQASFGDASVGGHGDAVPLSPVMSGPQLREWLAACAARAAAAAAAAATAASGGELGLGAETATEATAAPEGNEFID